MLHLELDVDVSCDFYQFPAMLILFVDWLGLSESIAKLLPCDLYLFHLIFESQIECCSRLNEQLDQGGNGSTHDCRNNLSQCYVQSDG